MSFSINGVTPKTIRVESSGSVTELNMLSVNDGSDKYVWVKPYTLHITQGAHSTLSITRISSPYALASLNALSDGSIIYYGDKLRITATAASGYTVQVVLNGTTQSSLDFSLLINGDKSISVIETELPSLINPQISGTFTYDSSAGVYNLNTTIRNPNFVNVTAAITVYANGEVVVGTRLTRINSRGEYKYAFGEISSAGARVEVKYEALGYQPSSSSATFGQYSSVPPTPPDETTTTTTTS